MRIDHAGPAAAGLAIVLLHPHPHFGGDRHHPFIERAFAALSSEGFGVSRFDFTTADPTTAVEEIRGAMASTAERWPTGPIILAGYSFGASMSLRMRDDVIAGWFLVAPPEATLGEAVVADDGRPKLLLVPERDQFSSFDGVADATADWQHTEVRAIAGDHYLGDALGVVTDSCVEFARAIHDVSSL